MTEPQEVPTSTILNGLHRHIVACAEAESSLKGMVGDMVSAGNGRGQPNPGLIIPGRPTTPPNGPNERQISATSLQAEALLLQGQRLLALAVGTLLDKQEHGTSGKVGDERGSQSPEAAQHRPLCATHDGWKTCDCRGATSQGSQQHGSSVSTRTAVNPSPGKG